MQKIRIFISSVQNEFMEIRKSLNEYLYADPLLGKFFDPFIFELMPASGYSAVSVFLSQVEQCDIYLGIFGIEYGFEDIDGVSSTEREYNHACLHHKTRLIFISNHKHVERNPKEVRLIKRAEHEIIRKRFISIEDLRSSVYASLVKYLEEKELIRTLPFDASLNNKAKITDLDTDKIKEFVNIARAKRGFPLPLESSSETILTHLNLLDDQRLTNAAILLFGKLPQRFFITSEVKCAHFHGFEVQKPIPSYQVYKGDVFQLVQQAVDFVLSKIDLYVGSRNKNATVDVQYELPIEAVTEAIVNAVAHRDYTSNASIQVMLFKDRLEVSNPGALPYGLTISKLYQPHSSIPANPLLAEPMYLRGTIERMGTGTGDIIAKCRSFHLKDPEFYQDEMFKIILWRPAKYDGIRDLTIDANGKELSENGKKTARKRQENGKKIIEAIIENQNISINELAETLEISIKTVRTNIDKLKQKGLLIRIGPDKGGYWKVIEK